MDKGKMVDAVGRLYKSTKTHATKWKRYGNSRRAYVCGAGHTAIVVEDCISATQALEFEQCAGFAIMGTALLSEHIQQLQQYKQVIVALDPDALTKTVAYTRQLKSSGIDAYALKLYDDLKYRQPQDMQRVRSLIEKLNGTCLTEESP
jgi:5S rRNA maturation endonuclease (ribonuclease M5)